MNNELTYEVEDPGNIKNRLKLYYDYARAHKEQEEKQKENEKGKEE